jgi:DNA-binding CsgD family transcriptional regulator
MDALSPGQISLSGYQVHATPHFFIASSHWWFRRALSALVLSRYPGARVLTDGAPPATSATETAYILVTDQPQLAHGQPLAVVLGDGAFAAWQQDETLVLAAIESALSRASGDAIWGRQPPRRRGHASTGNLTRRQQDVLACLAQGQSNATIARALGMSENTVRIHVSAILKALGMDNRTQAALWANSRLGQSGSGSPLFAGQAGQ